MHELLGRHIAWLLSHEPFSKWKSKEKKYEVGIRMDIHYLFLGHLIEVCCDANGVIRSVLVDVPHNEEGWDWAEWMEVGPGTKREEIIKKFGDPAQSSHGFSHPILGEQGPWDRFDLNGYSIHIQYGKKYKRVSKVTYMTSEFAASIK